MKKTLIAVAALVATGAFAQSSVTIGGVLDMGFLQTKADGTGTSLGMTVKNTGYAQNNTATSAIVIRGSEDLGAGMQAKFLVETNPDMTGSISSGAAGALPAGVSGSAFGNGQRFVGLAGGFGEMRMGAVNSAELEVLAGIAQPFGTALGGADSGAFSRTGNGAGIRNVRSPNGMRYDTPVFFGGLSGSLETSVGNTNALGVMTSYGYQAIGLRYMAGPLQVGFSTSSVKNSGNAAATVAQNLVSSNSYALAAGEKGTVNALGANYAFGPATVYAGYTKSTSNISGNTAAGSYGDNSSMNVGVKYAVSGALALSGNYTKRKDNQVGAASAGNALGLGADYGLSKRTFAYARYEKLDTNANNVGGVLGKRTAVSFGLRHAF